MNRIRIIAAVTFLILSLHAAFAERINGTYKGANLAEALTDISKKSSRVKINFIYDKLETYPVSCSFDDASPIEAIRTCIGFYPVSIRTSGKNIFVEAIHDDLPKFSGIIRNISGQPVEFATIRIYNPADSSFITGGVSNADGYFVIPVMPCDAIVQISAIGLRRVERNMVVEGNKTFTLESDPIVLRNLNVVHNSISYRDNALIITPSKIEVEHSADIFQLLMQQPIPALYVDPLTHSVTIMGRKPIILVDGIERDSQYLLTLDPSKIAKFEYTTDVPQKYITNEIPVGLINIVLKERTNGGNTRVNLTQAVNAGFTTGGISASYNKGRSEFSISYNPNRRDYKNLYSEYQNILTGKDFVVNIDSRNNKTMKYFNHYLNFYWNYIASSKVSLSFTVNDAITDSHNTAHEARRDSYLGNVNRYSSVKNTSHSPLFDAYLRYTPTEADLIEVQITTQIQNLDYDRTLNDTMPDGQIEKYPSFVNTHYNFVKLTGSWIHNVNDNFRLEVSDNGYYARSRNLYHSIDQRYLNTEILNSLNARANFRFKNVNMGISTGLRYIRQSNITKKRTIFRNQSSISLWMPIGKLFNFSFYADYFPGHPTLSAITEMEQEYDGYLTTNGNASLKNPPIFELQQRLNFNKGKWWAQLQLSQYIAHHLSYYNTTYIGDHKFLTRPVNMNNNFVLNHSISAGARGIFNGHLSMNLTATHSYNLSNGHGFEFKKHLFNYSASVTGYYKNCSLTFMAGRNSSVFAMSVSKDTPSNRLLFDWNPTKGLNLQIGWWYIFNKDGHTSHNYIPANQVYSRDWVNDNYRMVTLGVSYNFNFGRKFDSKRRNLYISGGSADTKLVQ